MKIILFGLLVLTSAVARADNTWTFTQECQDTSGLQKYLISQGFAIDYIQNGAGTCIVHLSDSETKDPTVAVGEWQVSPSTGS